MLLKDFVRDLRYAVRSLRRTPGLSILAVCTLAVGIGAGTAMFSVLRGVLLSDLPVEAQDELVQIRKPIRLDPSITDLFRDRSMPP
jgi:hypothetical protein